jgi:hypothetical protein
MSACVILSLFLLVLSHLHVSSSLARCHRWTGHRETELVSACTLSARSPIEQRRQPGLPVPSPMERQPTPSSPTFVRSSGSGACARACLQRHVRPSSTQDYTSVAKHSDKQDLGIASTAPGALLLSRRSKINRGNQSARNW